MQRALHILRNDALGGLERSTFILISLLQRKKVEQAVLFLSPVGEGISRELSALGIQCFSIPYRRQKVFGFLISLFGFIREQRPRLLLIHGCFGLHSAISAIARLAGVSNVWVFVVMRPPKEGFARWLQQLSAHLARWSVTGEIVVSRYLREFLVREYRLPSDRVHIAYRWRDIEGIRTRTQLVPARAEIGPVFGCIARLDWMKDYDTLIRAFAKVVGEVPSFAC